MWNLLKTTLAASAAYKSFVRVMLSTFRLLAFAAVSSSLSAASTIPLVAEAGLVARQAGGPAQDSRSCLSIRLVFHPSSFRAPLGSFPFFGDRDVCYTTTIPAADASNALNTHPACIALVVCETPKYFFPDFPPNQPRLTREVCISVSSVDSLEYF